MTSEIEADSDVVSMRTRGERYLLNGNTGYPGRQRRQGPRLIAYHGLRATVLILMGDRCVSAVDTPNH